MFTLDNFYKSDKWLKVRNELIATRVTKEGATICEYCGKPIVKKYDLIVHHRVELTEDNVNDYSISLNKNNLMLVHFKCHNELHERWNGFDNKKHAYLVYGSPCSGKSTWVEKVATPNDVIVDIDKIWEAITINDRYTKNNNVKQSVFAVRDCLIDNISTRCGNWHNAYYITTECMPLELERIRLKLGARIIHIDTDKTECLSRAKNDDWKKYIEDYFTKYNLYGDVNNG